MSCSCVLVIRELQSCSQFSWMLFVFVFCTGTICLFFVQEPFDPEEFVERLAWRTVADSRGEGTGHFDPVLLHETFLQAIK
jgi:hypothetical protein